MLGPHAASRSRCSIDPMGTVLSWSWFHAAGSSNHQQDLLTLRHDLDCEFSRDLGYSARHCVREHRREAATEFLQAGGVCGAFLDYGACLHRTLALVVSGITTPQ